MNAPASTTTPSTTSRPDARIALLTQFSTGPSFRETATLLLREALQEQYPTLDIDPDTVMLATPTWNLDDDRVSAGPTEYQALSDILARQAVLAVPILYLQGEHFLTQQPIIEPAVHLPVRVTEIAKTINQLAPSMLRAYQQQTINYWNQTNGSGPHWHELSNLLRTVWDVEAADDWTATECAMARALFTHPDKADRKGNDLYKLRACLVDIDRVDDEGQVKHVNDVIIAVLIGEHEGKTTVLTHSLLKGYEKFPSLEHLGQSLPAHLSGSVTDPQIQWRLFEPDGNFFDHQACALVSLQIDTIAEIDFSDLRKTNNVDMALGTPPAAAPPPAQSSPDLAWYREQMPDWLTNASPSDSNFYARHLKDLAALHNQNAGRSFLDDVPTIEAYALKVIKAKVIKDHPDSTNLPLEKIFLQIESPVVWGAFVVPGQVESNTFSLVELALQNLIAVPVGNKVVKTSNGSNLPEWMTPAYFESLATDADIGRTYPALIKEKLLDDTRESARRNTLYSQHLRIQLPMQALQAKIRLEGSIDERGYRYVTAVMQEQATDSKVDGQTIVLRPLAFVPTRRTDTSVDTVANMYVIGPEDPAAGPCLLYRPLFTPALMQFPSPANLIYTIAQSSSLCESVLAWLPDAVRSDYTNYVFPGSLPSPWAVADYLVEPDKLWTMSGPMTLGTEVLNGDRFTTMFKANAQALIELADRQSVSNAESRWATFKHAGWVIFNGVLPFLGRTIGTGAWIWQVVDQLQTFVQAHDHDEKQAEWSALTDVLLNLGMAITLHAASRSHRTGYPRKTTPKLTKATSTKQVTIKQEVTLTKELPATHLPHLHTSGAIKRIPSELATVLDSFKVSKPQGLGAAQTAKNQYQHLFHQAQKYYAPVGERWFEVSAGEDEAVFIIDPKQPGRTGPALIHNAQGQWFIDTRLRLRGAGSKQLQEQSKSKAEINAIEAQRRLTLFEQNKPTAQLELQQAHLAMSDTASSTSSEVRRQTYLQKLKSQSSDYEKALQQLKILNVFSPSADYQQHAIRYVNAQLELTRTGITEAQVAFTPKLKTVLDQVEHQISHPQERHIDDARIMTELSQDMIQRLNYSQSRLTELKALGELGFEQIRNYRSQLPSYTARDLRALQVSLARNLCLDGDSIATASSAWSAIDTIVDTANLSIQALHETSMERSQARLDERIETLGSLVEQFKIIDERLQDFPDEFPDAALPARITTLREKIRDFYRETLGSLELLHADRDTLRSRPTPPSTPPRAKKKIIHTRYNGVLVGVPRLTEAGDETGMVDVISPLNQQIMATFHEKTPGVWVQHVNPVETTTTTTTLDVATSISQAQELLDGLGAFKQRTGQQAIKPERSATGIEWLYHQHALKLEQASANIEQALTQSNSTESNGGSAALVNKQLSEAAQALYQEAARQKLQMIKKRPPTISSVEWLKQNNEIVIKRTVKRRRLKGPVKVYLDEYTLSNRSDKTVLWYAHFHYSAEWVPARAFLRGRLKTPQEHARGVDADSLDGLNEQQKTAFYLSEINRDQAQRLFFKVK
ncbi:DUF6543 domain-containing protein [Pseudomonas sp. B329]|uniref:dermonecrotic toxin domain-containing protein n=1 Tax=Pseudomonas sp. B329 TaxID=1553459 RepID=UPI0020064247|nr:DUF6543 domain-containing protein [Pseudomonas sp. B329]MCK3865171.1 hypothetical protein [Pseudomonas sp. B329]